MADIRFQVSELFQIAFGINSPVFITEPLLRQPPENISFKGLEVLPQYYEPEGMSWMGTPIVFPAKLLGGSYMRYKPSGELERVQMQDTPFPPATMFGFRRAKNITRTQLLGSSGTVKEIYGFDDWVIDVRGLCLDEPDKSAEQQLKELLEWENLADSLKISGRLFSQMPGTGITAVSMADWSHNVQQAAQGVIAFQCQLYSDEPVELLLI